MEMQKIFEYNSELKEGLSEMYNMLPPGQKKQVLKNPKVKALLIKFHIIEENDK